MSQTSDNETRNSVQAVPLSEKVSYAIASGGGNIVTQVLGTFLTGYLTDSVGLAAAAVGTMMLVARVVDAVSDITMGAIVDKTNTRWGKARPWLLVSAPLICVALILTFSVPTGWEASAKLVYAYISYIFLNCICYTAFMVPHTAMLSRVSVDGNERQTMASMNQIVNQIGGLAVTTFMAALVALVGWQMTAVIYGVVTAICILIGFFGTREHVDVSTESDKPKAETVPVKVALPAMLKNKYFYLETALFILILAQTAGAGSMTYYYCNVVLGNLGILAFISACGIVPTMIINLFIPSLAKRYGRRKCLLAASVCSIIGFLMVSVTTSLAVVCIGFVIKAFAGGVFFGCGFAMASDVVDYGEWKTGIRSEGLINSCVSFGQKVGLGLGPAIATWILAAGGYDGLAETQSASAIFSIKFAFGWLGVIIAVLLLIVVFFMDIDKYKDQVDEAMRQKHLAG
ncbi:MAG: MFS transporter [Clostridiales bacterium]|nr:MFS transporter [Clostridiales bacterium]